MNYKILSIIISCPFWSALFIYFLNNMYNRKYKKKVIYLIIFFTFSIVLAFANVVDKPLIKTGLTFFMLMILTVLFYEPKGREFLLYNTYFILSMVALDIMSVLVYTYIFPISINKLMKCNALMFFTDLPILMISPILCRWIIRVFRHQKLESINIIESLFLICKVAFELFLITYIASLVGNSLSNTYLLLIVSGILLFDYFLMYIFEYVSEFHKLKKENDLYMQRSLMMNRYYNETEVQLMQTRKLVHDIRNHMNIIDKLYKGGENIVAEKYQQEVIEKLSSLSQHFVFKNRIISLLFNDTYATCRAKQIEFIVNVEDIKFDRINEFDLTTIFGNLLDNAIDACSKKLFS